MSYWPPLGQQQQPPPRVGPSLGLPVALLGAVLALLGFFALDWATRADFFDARTAVDDHQGRFNPFTQVYFLALWVPLLVVTLALGIVVTLGPVAARIGTTAAGVLGGLSLVGLVVVVEAGAVGDDQSRHDATPVLVAIGVAGVISVGLGVAAYFERRGVFARSLAGVLAVLAAVAHLAVVSDLFADNSDADLGAWLPAVGFALLALAAAVPYRRPATPAPSPPVWGSAGYGR